MGQLGPIIGVAAVCCLLGAAIGSSKGQGGAGAVLGLLLGPLGLLFCLFMKPTVAYQAQRDIAVEQERERLRAEALDQARAEVRAEQHGGGEPYAPPASRPQPPADPWDTGQMRQRG